MCGGGIGWSAAAEDAGACAFGVDGAAVAVAMLFDAPAKCGEGGAKSPEHNSDLENANQLGVGFIFGGFGGLAFLAGSFRSWIMGTPPVFFLAVDLGARSLGKKNIAASAHRPASGAPSSVRDSSTEGFAKGIDLRGTMRGFYRLDHL